MARQTRATQLSRLVLILIALACLASLFWSFWTETLQPFIRQKQYVAAAVEAGGFLLALASVGLMAYSAYLFLKATFVLWQDPHFQYKVAIVQNKRNFPPDVVRRTRRENLAALWLAWRPALVWMGVGWGVMMVAGLLIRLAEGRL